ncbi:Bug family tripartite tricarboxylate transporter substrate binding protein [Pseudorhodoferax sp.]|uniref:Bug family tripartite tricarboxylate transporter substrate binding protein n=1 Tax=Pseudorhodoferax sp. TaxID=1993553 RepID=UPI0039E62CE9
MSDFQPNAARRTALRAALIAGSALLAVPAVHAQAEWPTKPVTIVVGYPPGGQTDFVARALTTGMQKVLGQPVIIDNRGGMNGNIGNDYVMKSPPDGYRLLAGNGVMTIAPHTYKNTPVVDPLKLTPIGTMLTSGLVLVVPATSPIKDYQQFVRFVQEEGKKTGINYGSSGAGGLTHVTMELLRERLGKPAMNHVPYKGGAAVAVDLIAGRVEAIFDAVSVVSPFIKSGQMRPLMVTTRTRVPILPDVPTADEVGLKDFEISSFIGFYGPPGLPAAVVQKANAAMNAALKDPAVVRSVVERGDEPGGGTPEDLAKLTRDQFTLWGAVVKANDIRAD